MTDDDLIELSAKAMGLEGGWQYSQSERYGTLKKFVLDRNSTSGEYNVKWNPLKNDLQASVLLDWLPIEIKYSDIFNIDSGNFKEQVQASILVGKYHFEIYETIRSEASRAVALRHVIVQAAAFVGSKLP